MSSEDEALGRRQIDYVQWITISGLNPSDLSDGGLDELRAAYDDWQRDLADADVATIQRYIMARAKTK